MCISFFHEKYLLYAGLVRFHSNYWIALEHSIICDGGKEQRSSWRLPQSDLIEYSYWSKPLNYLLSSSLKNSERKIKIKMKKTNKKKNRHENRVCRKVGDKIDVKSLICSISSLLTLCLYKFFLFLSLLSTQYSTHICEIICPSCSCHLGPWL